MSNPGSRQDEMDILIELVQNLEKSLELLSTYVKAMKSFLEREQKPE